MRPIQLHFLTTALVLSPLLALGQSPYERELQQLKEQREKALAAAADPINRRFQISLEQLGKRATQANDLDAAVKIKSALQEIPAPAVPQGANTTAVGPDGKKTFSTPESLLASIPKTISLKKGGKWNAAAAAQANETLKEEVVGNRASIKVIVGELNPRTQLGFAFCIVSTKGKVNLRGETTPFGVFAYFKPDQTEALSKVQIGSSVTVSGNIAVANIAVNSGEPRVILDLWDCKIIPNDVAK